MYSFLIKLAHGFTLIPLVIAFKKNNIFSHLEKYKSFEELIALTKVNPGYVNAGLKLLLIFSVIKKKNNKYIILNKELINIANEDFIFFYNQSFKKIISNQKNINIINKYHLKLINGWNLKIPNEILSGPFLVPIIFSLKFDNKFLRKLNSEKYKNLKEILISYNILKLINKKKLVLTSVGKYLVKNIFTIGVAASYKKMLFNISNLLNYDPGLFFNKKLSTENHIDRNLNIESSSSQHNKYFNEIINLIETIFTKKNKPQYVMDIGCGDGWLLKKIYNKLQSLLSAKEIKKIKMIGVDLNTISIKKAKKKLAKIPILTIQNSIDNPELIFKKLKDKKIDPNKILHVKSFIDHERQIKVSNRIYNNRDIINQLDEDIDGINTKGKNINSILINKSLDNFYYKWSKYIGKFGLINLEVFKQSLNDMKKNLDLNEGAHFDFIQTFSGQNLCKAKMQFYCMARNQLFPEIIRTYPESTKFKRIVLGYFMKEKYSCLILSKRNKKFDIQLMKKFGKKLKVKNEDKKRIQNFEKFFQKY